MWTRILLPVSLLALAVADRRILESIENKLNSLTGGGKVKRYRCIEEYVTLDNEGKSSIGHGKPFAVARAPTGAVVVEKSSSLRQKNYDKPIKKRRKKPKRRNEGYVASSTRRTTVTTTPFPMTTTQEEIDRPLISREQEDPNADLKIEEMLQQEEGNFITTTIRSFNIESNPIKSQTRSPWRVAAAPTIIDDQPYYHNPYQRIPPHERTRSALAGDLGYNENTYSYDYDYVDTYRPLLRRRILSEIMQRRRLQQLPQQERTTIRPRLQPITMPPLGRAYEPPTYQRPMPLPPPPNTQIPPQNLPLPVVPLPIQQQRPALKFEKASAENCARIPQIASQFGVKDVRSFARSNCRLLLAFAPGATCEQINYFIDSCQKRKFL